jgi:hypothetical protein
MGYIGIFVIIIFGTLFICAAFKGFERKFNAKMEKGKKKPAAVGIN